MSVTKRAEWRRGWHVVAAAMLGLGSGPLVYQYVSSIFMASMIVELHWTHSQAASVTSMMAMGALASPLIGALTDRVGPRSVILSSTVGVAGVYTLFAVGPNTITNYRVAVAMLYMIGVGCSALSYSRVINTWFSVSRGMALAIASTGVSIGALLLPRILGIVMSHEGWRAGYLLLAGLTFGIGIPAAMVMFIRPMPDEVRENGPVRQAGHEGECIRWTDVLRRRAFWLILAAMFLVHVSASAILTHFVPIMTAQGVPRGTVLSLLSFYGICSLAGRFGTGILLDRRHPHRIAGLITSFSAMALILLFVTDARSLPAAALVVLLLGLQMGAELDLLPFFLARHIGLKRYSATYGVMASAIMLSGGIGTQLFGILYDRSGSYTPALAMALTCFVLGSTCFLLLGRSRTVADRGAEQPAGGTAAFSLSSGDASHAPAAIN